MSEEEKRAHLWLKILKICSRFKHFFLKNGNFLKKLAGAECKGWTLFLPRLDPVGITVSIFNLLGELLLDKNPHIKTVVNKTNSIEETFRFFKMELLAGEDNMVASVNEHGCLFEFDYSKVYWNSRLQTEHQRIAAKVKEGDIVFDVFAGVGPFAIPVAKKKNMVYANDLNKVSYESLIHNGEINKVSEYITAYNLDGRDFLDSVVIPKLSDSLCSDITYHIIMNLPAIAPQFLDVFKKYYDNVKVPLHHRDNIKVHCYCFSKSHTPKVHAKEMIFGALGIETSQRAEVQFVRRVSPNKVMLCVSFNLFWLEPQAKQSDGLVTRKRELEGNNAKLL